MSDPLSIAASVAGLLATAGTICTTLSSFIDAPESARAALAAVEEVRLALEMVQQLVDTVSALSSLRRALVRLDHIAITFSNCIRTLSELESLVCFKDNIMHRLRWVWGEKKVLQLLPRLESQKASLLLMVTVLRWYYGAHVLLSLLVVTDNLAANRKLRLSKDGTGSTQPST